MTDQLHADEGAEPRTASALMARIDADWNTLSTAIGALSEPQLTTITDDNGWAVKDHLVHITAWEQSLLALIEGRDRAAAVGLDGVETDGLDTDALNALIQERGDGQSLEAVQAAFERSHAELMAALRPLSDADLQLGYSHYQPNDPPQNNDPVIGWVAGNTYEHYAEHLGWIKSLVGA